ncbi:MAG TPA: hypothetical protein VKA09_07520 [Nitrososphaeraceae archaeon]|nr:hypothetical protein [Nitrososphaeraceae archaeon]
MENVGKASLTIRARNVTLEIVEASEGKIKIKSNCAGQVNGSLYSGSYNDTVEAVRNYSTYLLNEIANPSN